MPVKYHTKPKASVFPSSSCMQRFTIFMISIPSSLNFQPHYQTVAIDWPWHGESSHPVGQNPTAPFFADVLEDIVTSLKLAPAIFIGNSVGGFAAARLAITHPENVKALVIVNAGGFVQWNWISKFFTRLLGIPTLNRWIMPSLVLRYMSPQSAHDTEIANQVSELAKTAEGSNVSASLWKSFIDPGHDLRGRAGEIKAPVLIIWGKRDSDYTIESWT